MKYAILPGTNEKVSSIGLGTWVFGAEHWGGAKEEESLAAVDKAVEAGVNFIDLAPFYGDGLAEKIVGKAVAGKRDRVFIATKCGLIRGNGRVAVVLTPESIEKELDLSRQRLGVDVIDLYQCHWPDKNTPVEKTMEAMQMLQSKGRIRHIGVSNFDLELLKQACAVAPVKTLQVQYSILERSIEKDLLPFCVEQDIGVIAYGAMGGGILSGKYQQLPNFGKSDARRMFYKFYEEKRFREVSQVVEAMREIGRPLNQVALNWVRQRKGVLTVLAGCRTPVQVLENAAAADWDLEPGFGS